MATSRTCDGVRRRDFLKVGALGAGLSLASYLRLAAAGQVQSTADKAGILIYLGGGPSHLDSFDLKPEAPEEYRGEFKPIQTNVPGIEISEHLPKLAQVADKFAILRGVSHTLAAHQLGKMYLNTGNRPLASLTYPSYGAVAMKEFPAKAGLPVAVAVPGPVHPAGYLGVHHSPLATGAVPKAGQPFVIRGMTLRQGLEIADVERRQDLLSDLDAAFRGYEQQSDVLAGLDQFSQQAHDIIRSSAARAAFDVSQERPEVAAPFGEGSFGLSCLLAARLVEAGVRFVTIELNGWDTHGDNFNKLKNNLLPQLDAGLSSLLAELDRRGLLAATSVLVTGEFGRTPKVNQRAGRDHYPRAMFVLLAGGGMQGGRAVGASDDKGTQPAGDTITPDSVAATFYHSLGIDARKEYQTGTGRPVMLVREGQVIQQLFS